MTNQVFFLLILLIVSVTGKLDWHYRIDSFNWTSSNEQLLATPIRPVRISPGVYGLSGTIKLGMQMDNSLTLAMKVYRSPVGNGNFVMTPYRIQKMSLYDFMNTIYRQFVRSDIKNCSDLPVPVRWPLKEPIGPVVFHLDKCLVGSGKLPTVFRTGFYKTVLTVANPFVELVTELVAQV